MNSFHINNLRRNLKRGLLLSFICKIEDASEDQSLNPHILVWFLATLLEERLFVLDGVRHGITTLPL